MTTPSVTPIQQIVVAALGLINIVLGGLAVFDVPITIEQVAYLNAVAGGVGTVFLTVDAYIRGTRAKNADKIATAKFVMAQAAEPEPEPERPSFNRSA